MVAACAIIVSDTMYVSESTTTSATVPREAGPSGADWYEE
jgi:hypothetical protein